MSVPDVPPQEQHTSALGFGWRGLMLMVLGVALWALLVVVGGLGEIRQVTRPNPLLLLAVIAAVAFMIFIYALRWGTIVNSLAGRRAASPLQYYFYSLSGQIAGLIGPQIASMVVVRSAAIVRFGKVSIKQSTAALVIDKLFDTFFAAMFAWPVILITLEIATVFQIAVIAAVEFAVLTVLIVWRYEIWLRLLRGLASLAIWARDRLPILKKIERLNIVDELRHVDEWNVFQQKVVLPAYALTAVGQLSLVLRSWLIARAIGLDIAPWPIFFGVALAQVSLIFAVTPGALGFLEGAWFIALTSSGVDGETVAAFLIVHRVFSNLAGAVVWLVVFLGVMASRSSLDDAQNTIGE